MVLVVAIRVNNYAEFFEVDRYYIVVAAFMLLQKMVSLKVIKVSAALKKYGLILKTESGYL